MCDLNKKVEDLTTNNDHREIGKKLSLFTFDEMIGSGMPIWLEKGNQLKEIIASYINDLQRKNGILMVKTPILGTEDLYKCSGHLNHYQDNIFPSIPLENKKFILRPMTCPHHILLAKKMLLSHKSFPLAFGENAMLYRNEYSGGLFGLERVRSMELIDTHIFVLQEQIESEIHKICCIIFEVIKMFEIELDSIALAVQGSNKENKFHKDPEMWEYAEKTLNSSMQKLLLTAKEQYGLNINCVKDEGGAAFYGPKIDFQIKTNSKKIITLSTIQLDFLLPKKFNLTYKNEKQEDCHPVLIHLGIIGTLERFIAYLIEKTGGNFPVWLAPIQVIIIPINVEQHKETCLKLMKLFQDSKIRASVDLQEQNSSKKIANAQVQKIPFQILIGNKEKEDLTNITYKEYGKKENTTVKLDFFIEYIKQFSKHLN